VNFGRWIKILESKQCLALFMHGTLFTAMSCSEFWSLDQNPRVQTMFGTVHMNSDPDVDRCGASKSRRIGDAWGCR
jgi:hypothetical protein